jgi:hypothetical protein
VDCASGAPLARGTYELHAFLDITTSDGRGVLAVGGPWPLEVR